MFDWVLNALLNTFRLFSDAIPIQLTLISSKSTIKTLEKGEGRRSGVSIVNFVHISHLFLVFLLLTLNN